MLDPKVLMQDLHLDHWKRLMDLALYSRSQRSVILLHEAGKPQRLFDSEAGELPLPGAPVKDAQATADALLAAHPQAASARVIDPQSLRLAIGKVAAGVSPGEGLLDYLEREWEACQKAKGCAWAPATGFLWHGIPVSRVRRFAAKMLPASCTYVLAVFDAEQLWASLLLQFQDGRIVDVRTSDALDQADLKEVVGRDQHPFLLAMVANTFKRPAFGWFVERPAFEAYMKAATVEAKDEVFQKALMQGQATFDFNILIDRGITPLAPIDPGQAAVAGAGRGDNPRTRVPDPGEPGPSAF